MSNPNPYEAPRVERVVKPKTAPHVRPVIVVRIPDHLDEAAVDRALMTECLPRTGERVGLQPSGWRRVCDRLVEQGRARLAVRLMSDVDRAEFDGGEPLPTARRVSDRGPDRAIVTTRTLAQRHTLETATARVGHSGCRCGDDGFCLTRDGWERVVLRIQRDHDRGTPEDVLAANVMRVVHAALTA